MSISCEECRENLEHLVPPRGLATPHSGRETSAIRIDTPGYDANKITLPATPEARNTGDEPFSSLQSPEVEAREVQAHVASCEACSRESMRLRRMVEVLHDFPVVPAPVDLRARIQFQLQAEAAPGTHAAAQTANARELAADATAKNGATTTTTNATVTREDEKLRDTNALRGAAVVPDRKGDFARVWSRWTRSLRHPAKATWAGGAVLCALALVVASRTPNSLAPPTFAPSSNTSNAETRLSTPSTANAPASSQKATKTPSTPRPRPNSLAQKPASDSADPTTSSAASPATASGELNGASSNPMQRATTPGASAPDNAGGTGGMSEQERASNGAVSSAANSRAARRVPAPSAASPAPAPKAAPSIAAQRDADVSTHGEAQGRQTTPRGSESQGAVRQSSKSALPGAVSMAGNNRQAGANKARQNAPESREANAASSRASRLARLELLPSETLQESQNNALPSDAPASDSTRDQERVSARDSQNLRLKPRAPIRAEAASEEAAPSRRALPSDAPAPVAPRAGAFSSGAPPTGAPSTAAAPAGKSRNRTAKSSEQAASLAARADAATSDSATPDALDDKPATRASSQKAPPGASSTATSGAFSSSGETANGMTARKINPPILHRSGNTSYLGNAPHRAANRTRRALLRVSPLRDSPRARVRVVLWGVAWSGTTSATASKPRIVWQGRAHQGREIEIPLSFALLSRAASGATMRVELQQARGKAWQTLQSQNVPVAFP